MAKLSGMNQYVNGLVKKNSVTCILQIFSYSSVVTYVLGAQKSRLIEMVFLSTHNICFG